ncbi:MAG: hypothetical protein RIE77_11470 [Phycisphaerales bacterium]|jgi:hypothetical protein
MSDNVKKKPNAIRQAVTLLLALAIFALAAVVIYPKLQQRTQGPVRLDVVNGTGGSMIDTVVSLRVPANQNVGGIESLLPSGAVITVYDGLGPAQVESISFTAGVDGEAVTHAVDRALDPGGVMVLRITADGITVDVTDAPAETPDS